MHTTSHRALVALSLATIGVLAGIRQAAAADKYWGGATDTFRSANWSGAAPAVGDHLFLSSGNIQNASSTPAGAVILSPTSADGQSLQVSGGSLSLSPTFGDAILQVSPGGSLDVSGGAISGDRLKLLGGTYSQTGGATSFTWIDFTEGLMDLRGGTVSWAFDKRLTVSGAAGTAVTPTVAITQNGQIDSTGQIYVGLGGGKGAVTVTGPNARMATGPHIWLGYTMDALGNAGEGSLTITDGATVSTTGQTIVGQYGGKANLTLRGTGSSLSSDSTVSVGGSRDYHAISGYAASVGTLTIDTGATATVGGMMFGTNGGDGTGLITGTGTHVTSRSLLVGSQRYVNQFLGEAAIGRLTLSADATMTLAEGMTVGASAGKGEMLVTGADTSIAIQKGWLMVGAHRQIDQNTDAGAGDGDMRVEAGAQVTWAACLGVGYQGGKGLLTVDGAGSQIYGTEGWGALFIGDGSMVQNSVDYGPSDGELRISNGGRVDATNVPYAVALVSMVGSKGGTGRVVVDGAGSVLNVNNAPVYIGYDRPATGGSVGSMTVSAGGAVDMVGDNVVGGKGGDGTATITGNNSIWRVNGSLYVGKDTAGALGTGRVSLRDGGRLAVTGSLNIADGDTNELTIDHGILVAPTIQSGGKISLLSGQILGNLASSGTLGIAGESSINGDLSLTNGSLVFDLSDPGNSLLFGAAGVSAMLTVNGSADLSGVALQFIGGQPGTSYVLIDAASILGSFASVPEGYELTSEGGLLTVQPVPEPGLLIFPALAAFGLRRRRV